MISSLVQSVRLAPLFLALFFGAAAIAGQDFAGQSCDFGARGIFRSSAGDRIDVSAQGLVFENSTSRAQLTVKANYQVAQVRIAELPSLDFYGEIVSLYPRAFDSVRLPACVMLIRKGAHRAGLLPVSGGILFVEVSDHDPPSAQVFLLQ